MRKKPGPSPTLNTCDLRPVLPPNMKKKPGPKPDPEYGYRERLKGYSRGPTVSAKTNRILTVWRDVYSLPVGRIIDALMDFACERPDFQISLKGQRRRRREPL